MMKSEVKVTTIDVSLRYRQTKGDWLQNFLGMYEDNFFLEQSKLEEFEDYFCRETEVDHKVVL